MSGKRISTVRLIWLEAFVCVAESGSYKAAGEQLELDPTVIMKYIGFLQNWLKNRLLVRGKKTPTLTEFGKKFVPKAKSIIEILYSVRDPYIPTFNQLKEELIFPEIEWPK